MYKSRKTKLAIDKFPGETIIVDLNSGSYFSLRGGAASLWTLLEEGIDEQAIFNRLDDLNDEQKQQVLDFIDQLKSSDLIVRETEPLEAGSSSNSLTKVKLNFEPILFEKYEDMKDLILLDPIHEVDAQGWPHQKKAANE